MALVSMKLSPKERKEEVSAEPIKAPQYPYGLSLHIDKDELDKLGINSLPDVGVNLELVADVFVKDTHESKGSDGESHRSISLQITDMELNQRQSSKSKADILFGDK